jgi:hypothetical protein
MNFSWLLNQPKTLVSDPFFKSDCKGTTLFEISKHSEKIFQKIFRRTLPYFPVASLWEDKDTTTFHICTHTTSLFFKKNAADSLQHSYIADIQYTNYVLVVKESFRPLKQATPYI